MKVKDVIKTSAELLGLKNIINFIDNQVEDEDTLNEITNMVLAVNMTSSTIACSYVDLIATKKISVKSGFIKYSDICTTAIKEILGVYSLSGNRLEYSCGLGGINIGNSDTVEIRYSYFPEKVGIDDNIDYFLSISEMVFAMGVVAEYLYIKGELNDAGIWDKRFKSAIFNATRPKRNISIKARRW